MSSFFSILLLVLAVALLLLSRFALFAIRQPTTLGLWFLKVLVAALSPVFLLLGVLLAAAGWWMGTVPLVVAGALVVILYGYHIISVSRGPVFRKLAHRSQGQVVWQRDIPFYTIPGTGRQLLCDTWEPPASVPRSGVAFIYLHGSAWAVLDKDFGTRYLFRRLVRQGHVVMDVAYRLYPEVGMEGMVEDARQAVAWMKTHAVRYGVRADRVVIGGGSAGAHIALLAAYMPEGLGVWKVISLYGQADLRATYYHTCQHLVSHSALGGGGGAGAGVADGKGGGGMPSWLQQRMGANWHRLGFDKGVEPGILAPMLGGSPDTHPEVYAQFSPLTYVHAGCPPTLFIHGAQDILAPLPAIRQLQQRLVEHGVPALLHVIPQSDHAFDLILPRISPSAQNALRDIEWYLREGAGGVI